MISYMVLSIVLFSGCKDQTTTVKNSDIKIKVTPFSAEDAERLQVKLKEKDRAKADKARRKAQADIASLLINPDSARFRNVKVVDHGLGIMFNVCGEVNGKNTYGEYAGYRSFYYKVAEKAIWTDDEVNFPADYARVCRPSTSHSNVYYFD